MKRMGRSTWLAGAMLMACGTSNPAEQSSSALAAMRRRGRHGQHHRHEFSRRRLDRTRRMRTRSPRLPRACHLHRHPRLLPANATPATKVTASTAATSTNAPMARMIAPRMHHAPTNRAATAAATQASWEAALSAEHVTRRSHLVMTTVAGCSKMVEPPAGARAHWDSSVTSRDPIRHDHCFYPVTIGSSCRQARSRHVASNGRQPLVLGIQLLRRVGPPRFRHHPRTDRNRNGLDKRHRW